MEQVLFLWHVQTCYTFHRLKFLWTFLLIIIVSTNFIKMHLSFIFPVILGIMPCNRLANWSCQFWSWIKYIERDKLIITSDCTSLWNVSHYVCKEEGMELGKKYIRQGVGKLERRYLLYMIKIYYIVHNYRILKISTNS